jgi:hypothetical protein
MMHFLSRSTMEDLGEFGAIKCIEFMMKDVDLEFFMRPFGIFLGLLKSHTIVENKQEDFVKRFYEPTNWERSNTREHFRYRLMEENIMAVEFVSLDLFVYFSHLCRDIISIQKASIVQIQSNIVKWALENKELKLTAEQFMVECDQWYKNPSTSLIKSEGLDTYLLLASKLDTKEDVHAFAQLSYERSRGDEDFNSGGEYVVSDENSENGEEDHTSTLLKQEIRNERMIRSLVYCGSHIKPWLIEEFQNMESCKNEVGLAIRFIEECFTSLVEHLTCSPPLQPIVDLVLHYL